MTVRSALALAAVALAGCDGGDGGPLVDCTGGGVGSLRVDADVRGAGVAVVYDADGHDVGRVTGDETLDGLAGGAYLVEGLIDPQVVSTVTSWCAQQGVLAEELTVAKRSLEDVFLELTGRELRS